MRDAALAAVRTLVDLYALIALPLLLPEVERGCSHDNWRIRQSSIELLGDLLFKVPCPRSGARLHEGPWSLVLVQRDSTCLVKPCATTATWCSNLRRLTCLCDRWRAHLARCGWRAMMMRRAPPQRSTGAPSSRHSAETNVTRCWCLDYVTHTTAYTHFLGPVWLRAPSVAATKKVCCRRYWHVCTWLAQTWATLCGQQLCTFGRRWSPTPRAHWARFCRLLWTRSLTRLPAQVHHCRQTVPTHCQQLLVSFASALQRLHA